MATVFVSIEHCKNWERNGKNEFLRVCKGLSPKEKDSKSIAACGTTKDLKRAVIDVCNHVLKNSLKVEQVTAVIRDLISIHPEVMSILLDVMVALDVDTQCVDDRGQREKFVQLVTACLEFVPEKMIKERLDTDPLGEIGVIKDKRLFYMKLIKLKTKLFYKQQKFNLLREESEGYAKLITELNQEFPSSYDSASLLEVIKALIGCFNLDPNRVLDVILESFECRPSMESLFIPLIRSYMCNQNTLCEMLGFKFTFYQNTELKTPASLYTVAALMLQHGLIPLGGIYAHLKPRDADIVEEHKKDIQDARVYARNMNLVATTADKTAAAIADAKPDEERENSFSKFQANQKLGLCEALLRIGNWKHARIIISRMPEHYAASYQPICGALCKLLHVTIDPLYRKYCTNPKIIKTCPLPPLPNEYAPKQATHFANVKEAVFPMVCALGPQLHTDPILMVKLIRLARFYLSQLSQNATSESMKAEEIKVPALDFDFLTVLDEALLPSLSLLECNCCIAEEMWSLLKLYPYQQRYRLYGLWKNETYLNHPLLIRMKAEFVKKIKYIMKRLSKENVKQSGRHIGKLSHSNPGFLFEYILSQIQTWDNLITPVVDSLKYLTNISYDVLSYCIIEALANPEKIRMKHDGTSISLWLQSLSSFCGAVYKKYSIELTGLLQYVANQLKAEKSLDLIILKEIVQRMAGIEALEEMTNDQLEAMAGGELLRAEGGYFTQIRNTKKSSQRLKEALLEQELAVPLCLLMAQQRNCIIFKEEEDSHLKLVGKLYDQCQDTLVQFGSFLSSSLSMDDYMRRLPSIDKLMGEYQIASDVAFYLSRPMFSHAITSKFDELRKQDKSYRSAGPVDKMQKFLDVVEGVMTPVVDSVRTLYPSKIWEDISPRFFVTFWSLSMYDLHVPASSYEKEAVKLKAQISQIEENKDTVQSKKKKEVDRCKTLKDKLQDEEKKQRDHCDRVLARLQNEKDSWFLSRSAKNDMLTRFLQLCIFPRCVFTAMDAIYCAKFVHMVHNLKTPNFSTLICYDRIFCDITYTVTSCTENEANRYGRFLCAILETVMRWYSDKAIFEKECANYPGFLTKFRALNQSPDASCDHVDYENYRHVCHKWHYRITKALLACLLSLDYVQIRNSIVVLTKILPYYPMITNFSQAIEKRIENVRATEKDKRPDLYVIALGYAGQLKAKKSLMIPEHEFHQKETKNATKVITNQNGPKTDGQVKTAQASVPVVTIADTRIEKPKETGTVREKKVAVIQRVDKADGKPAPLSKAAPESQRVVVISNNSSSSSNAFGNVPLLSSSAKRDHNSTKVNSIAKDDRSSGTTDRDGERQRLTKDDKVTTKDERVSELSPTSHHTTSHKDRRDESKERDGKVHSRVESEREKLVERASSVTSTGSGGSHGQRRSVDPPETERDIKRRKVEAPSSTAKSPHHEERSREKNATKEVDRSVSQERKKGDKVREGKSKESREKTERKRDRIDDKDLTSPGESKRKKDEDAVKASGRQNGESESRERDRHKREDENVERKTRSRELRTETREEKKHHRTSKKR